MKPGNQVIITFYATIPHKTLGFCRLLGFKELVKKNDVIILTDGIGLFEIKPSSINSTVITYLTGNAQEKKEMGRNLELSVEEISENEFRFSDLNGIYFAVREGKKEEYGEPEGKPISICGTFREVSVETNDRERSVQWYENIGFKVTAREKNYTTIDDGKIVISLYKRGTCPHKFKNPSLTYFEPDMKKRIAELKKRGIKFIQEEKEIGMEGHAIAESPDGQYFFLFSVSCATKAQS